MLRSTPVKVGNGSSTASTRRLHSPFSCNSRIGPHNHGGFRTIRVHLVRSCCTDPFSLGIIKGWNGHHSQVGDVRLVAGTTCSILRRGLSFVSPGSAWGTYLLFDT